MTIGDLCVRCSQVVIVIVHLKRRIYSIYIYTYIYIYICTGDLSHTISVSSFIHLAATATEHCIRHLPEPSRITHDVRLNHIPFALGSVLPHGGDDVKRGSNTIGTADRNPLITTCGLPDRHVTSCRIIRTRQRRAPWLPRTVRASGLCTYRCVVVLLCWWCCCCCRCRCRWGWWCRVPETGCCGQRSYNWLGCSGVD